MSQEYDWSRFRVRINIEASKEAIYEAWTSQEMLELWFLRLAEATGPEGVVRGRFDRIQEGDRYKWLWYGYADDTAESGTFTECNGIDRIRFTFGKAGRCSVTIQEEAGNNVVQIEQTEIPTDEAGKWKFHVGCHQGWTFYLANLKSLLEGGIDLRNRNEELKGMLNS
ncbi:MAG: SRPBCC domain-containing protein [Sphingobacteriales bacterium]|nr:MAG: SRPBCC domain-containing protein [Sphingobacteriales bacterium]